MMQLLLACKQEGGRTTIVAGSIFFMFGRTVSYAFNGSRQEDLSLRPNDVIQWQAINDACAKGFDVFDFGEVPEGNTALAKFKSKWGSEPTRLYRYQAPGPEIASYAGTNLKSYATRFTEVVWRGLPLSVTAWLGDRIYSRL
jgi:lipid II:glycine glycyltransferase (peptidoglycan interpeptide bridge formation enzyme)